MSGKPMELSRCRETPPCGSPVLNAREHRRWHERVYISDERTPAMHRPRYVGVDDEPEPDEDSDVTQRDVAPPGESHTPGGNPSR